MANVESVRYPVLDDIRGITLISMILFHTMWDIVYIYGIEVAWYHSAIAYVWQQSICWTFILLSGFCWSFGHRKWKRGLTVFGAGLIITVVTLIIMPENRVVFGVLTLLGTCMLLMNLLEKILVYVPSVVGMAGSFFLFLLFRNINEGYLGFEVWNLLALPKLLYANLFTTYLGFTERGFYSTDYFSVLPWIYLFVTGYFLNRFCTEHGYLDMIKNYGTGVFTKLGKNSLLVYILHQPLVYGVLYLIMSLK